MSIIISHGTMKFRYILQVLSLLPFIANAHYLTSTAIAEDEKGTARLECWKFTQPFHTYPTVGMSLSLANVSNVTYVALPPRSGEGFHNPPHPMSVSPHYISVLRRINGTIGFSFFSQDEPMSLSPIKVTRHGSWKGSMGY